LRMLYVSDQIRFVIVVGESGEKSDTLIVGDNCGVCPKSEGGTSLAERSFLYIYLRHVLEERPPDQASRQRVVALACMWWR